MTKKLDLTFWVHFIHSRRGCTRILFTPDNVRTCPVQCSDNLRTVFGHAPYNVRT